jgi:hypothetical protein
VARWRWISDALEVSGEENANGGNGCCRRHQERAGAIVEGASQRCDSCQEHRAAGVQQGSPGSAMLGRNRLATSHVICRGAARCCSVRSWRQPPELDHAQQDAECAQPEPDHDEVHVLSPGVVAPRPSCRAPRSRDLTVQGILRGDAPRLFAVGTCGRGPIPKDEPSSCRDA